MQTAAVVILLLACAFLSLRLYGVERNLHNVSRQLRDREAADSKARLRLEAPSAVFEELLESVNGLLDVRQAEAAEYRVQEKTIRQQIANVSHDLRTPLTSILGYLQLLDGGTLTDAERREYLNIVQGRAKSLQSLITSFYDLSRIEGGEYSLAKEPVDLYSVLSRLCAEFYNDFSARGLDVTVELAEGLPSVQGDPGAVLRVFTNLVKNALEHGRGVLAVRLYREGETLVSAFSNDAQGLCDEDVTRVFERFYTADKMRTGQSTGLGLAIVKGLVERMGHRVEARLENGLFSVLVYWKPD